MKIHEYDFRLATEADKALPWVDYSTLAHIERCPTAGIVKYIAKKWPYERATNTTAADAGHAFHLMCAAWNVARMEAIESHGKRLFGELSSYPHVLMLQALDQAKAVQGDEATAYALSALYDASNYIQESNTRSIERIEEAFVRGWLPNQQGALWHPPIFAELAFEFVIQVKYSLGSAAPRELITKYKGRIDKIAVGRTGLLPIDYKTTSLGLNSSYSAQFVLTPQLIGYHIALCLHFSDCTISPYGIIEAVKIPFSKDKQSYMCEEFRADNIEHFLRFVITQYQHIDNYNTSQNIADTEMRTMSCNAYFSRCALLDTLCTLESGEKHEALEQFADYEWNPTND